jgi:hypothetical protein
MFTHTNRSFLKMLQNSFKRNEDLSIPIQEGHSYQTNPRDKKDHSILHSAIWTGVVELPITSASIWDSAVQ